MYYTVILPQLQRVTPENNRESISNHGEFDDEALANWDGWGEFFLAGKFSEYQGPTVVKLFRDGVKLPSYKLAQSAMTGNHGEVLNWEECTPTRSERYKMLIAAKASAVEEYAESEIFF